MASEMPEFTLYFPQSGSYTAKAKDIYAFARHVREDTSVLLPGETLIILNGCDIAIMEPKDFPDDNREYIDD